MDEDPGEETSMLLSRLVDTSRAVASTRSRTAKVAALATVLREASTDGPRAVELVTAFLSGWVPQGRLGVGWRALSDHGSASRSAESPRAGDRMEIRSELRRGVHADAAALTLHDVDEAFAVLAGAAGPGSASVRRTTVAKLMDRASGDEQAFLRGLITGEVRQGALDGVMQQAVAEASGISLAEIRRAAMLAGRLPPVAVAALMEGAEAVAGIDLRVMRPIAPMLAASEPAVTDVVTGERVWSAECKYDGIRIQAHKRDAEVRLFTRSLDDITARLPDVAEVIAALPASSVVLDGEAIALRPDGSPQPFQVTGARTAPSKDPAELRHEVPLSTVLFDLLFLDGESWLDRPLSERHGRLSELVAPGNLVPSVVTADAREAQTFFERMIASGHEGIVAKDWASSYAAGRRGGSWVKVKPRHTLDLVVLAVEYGSGRRVGKLSNIHLGARDPQTGGFVMLGKTFKGMTDQTLAWQTERFRELALDDTGWLVTVRPEQVVEIAFDGLQTSSRYPAGLALRFARVVRYRDDKRPEDADTIDTVRHIAQWGHMTPSADAHPERPALDPDAHPEHPALPDHPTAP